MTLPVERPPVGTVRDRLAARVDECGAAIVFPEEDTQIDWASLRDEALAFAWNLTARGAAKGGSVAIAAPYQSRRDRRALRKSCWGASAPR